MVDTITSIIRNQEFLAILLVLLGTTSCQTPVTEVSADQNEDNITIVQCSVSSEFDPGIYQREDGIYHIVAPVEERGCVQYAVEAFIDPKSVNYSSLDYEITLCHMCDEDMALYFWSLADQENEELVGTVKQWSTMPNLNRLDLTFSLRDAAGVVLPRSCAVQTDSELLGYIDCVNAFETNPISGMYYNRSPVLNRGESFVLKGETRTSSLFDYTYSSQADIQYNNKPIEHRSINAVLFQLPRLWPASEGIDKVIPERQRSIQCVLAGFHENYPGGHCPNLLGFPPRPEWSEDELFIQVVTFEDWPIELIESLSGGEK